MAAFVGIFIINLTGGCQVREKMRSVSLSLPLLRRIHGFVSEGSINIPCEAPFSLSFISVQGIVVSVSFGTSLGPENARDQAKQWVGETVTEDLQPTSFRRAGEA